MSKNAHFTAGKTSKRSDMFKVTKGHTGHTNQNQGTLPSRPVFFLLYTWDCSQTSLSLSLSQQRTKMEIARMAHSKL